MVTHAGADSDMTIVYFSLMINNKKEIIKVKKASLLERLSNPN
jgi:hypothetical protein